MTDKYIAVVYRNPDFIKTLKCYLTNSYSIIEKPKVQSVQQEICINPIVCIIIHLEQGAQQDTHFGQFKKRFSHIPCIAVITSSDMELARYCGSVGIECVLPYEKMDCISDEITRICTEKHNWVSLAELSINKENPVYTAIIRDALSIMERDYLKILNSSEIANLIDINECTLSREFYKFGLPGPKRILMYLKVQQAIKLMQNKGLNIREISSLSGFTEEKRMAECFHRMFGMPPGEYRIKNIQYVQDK
jgi:AraC-like DNA-binding protein